MPYKKLLLIALPLLLASSALASDNHTRVVESRPDAKIFRWNEFMAGDCHMVGATLVARPNGTASFDADLWTHTHGTDYWHATIHLLGQGRELGNSGNHDSGPIGHPHDGPDHRTHFHYDFNFPAGNFGAINEAWEHGAC